MTQVMPVALVAIAGLSLWVCSRVVRRPAAGTGAFAWLAAAIALWCTTSAGEAVAETLAGRLAWAKVQYLAIASVAPLWLIFTAEYGGVTWFGGSQGPLRGGPADTNGGPDDSLADKTSGPSAGPPEGGHHVRTQTWAVRLALWIVPAITVVVAATNEWHQALWASVTILPNGATAYAHAWWFYVVAGYSYILLSTGTVLVARRLRTSPPLFRVQLATLIGAAAFPWLGNILYIAGWRPGGIDVTPLAFGFSTLLFAWALYRNLLFDLVPVARDLVIDSLRDAMVVLDPARRIVDMNAAARELARRKGTIAPDDMRWLGRSVDTVLPLLRDTSLETTTQVLTSRMVWTGGEPASFQVDVLPVPPRGRALGAWILLLRDVTMQRRADAERDALQERVQQQQRRESLSILAGGLAHDFNNLLTGIVGNADLLRVQIPATTRMGQNVGAILLGAQRAADLVSKMLAYAGERHGTPERVNLDALTRDLLDLLRASAARHCTVNYAGQAAMITADPIQIRQVIMNLVINAADVVAEGSGTIDVRTALETLTPCELAQVQFGEEAAPGEYALLEVRDDGCGMDAETLRRIFQPFFTTKVDGHGLGLAAVQGIVLGHRGAMAVESRPGQGSRFRVWFPVSPEDLTHDGSPGSNSSGARAGAGADQFTGLTGRTAPR